MKNEGIGRQSDKDIRRDVLCDFRHHLRLFTWTHVKRRTATFARRLARMGIIFITTHTKV